MSILYKHGFLKFCLLVGRLEMWNYDGTGLRGSLDGSENSGTLDTSAAELPSVICGNSSMAVSRRRRRRGRGARPLSSLSSNDASLENVNTPVAVATAVIDTALARGMGRKVLRDVAHGVMSGL